jgi:hypothetical protein
LQGTHPLVYESSLKKIVQEMEDCLRRWAKAGQT